MPHLDSILTGGQVKKAPLKKLDKQVKRVAKQYLFLPQRASVELVCLSPVEGGAGLLPLVDQVDVACIMQALRLLTCSDMVIPEVAIAVLRIVVRR